MNLEQNRLETFNDWPADAPVSPERIARAGFFYTKRDYLVQCFACGMNLSEWNYGDQVMARHRSLNPHCPFVLSPTSSGNIPAVDQPRTVPSTSSPDYRNQQVRLSSFVNWPKSDIVTPVDLARAGFYYLKTSDNTKCAYCHGVVRAWEPNDIPDVEHKRHFPMCPFVMSIINPRLESSRTPGHRPEQDATFKNVNLIGDTVTGSLNELGVQKHNGPKRADYGTIESRLRSFATWSPYLMQTPDVLAQAGFYYEGLGDQVRCFHCDGGLRNWDPDDDPWTEHARWFPRCSFVNLVKGQEFVTACQIDTGLSPSTTQCDKVRPVSKKRQVTEEELQMHLGGAVASAALGIGMDMQRVKRALKQRLELTGRGYSQPDALVEAALNLQLEEDDGFDSNSPNHNQLSTSIAAVLSDISKAAESNTQNQLSEQNTSPCPAQQSAANGERAARPRDLSSDLKLKKSVSLEEENRILKEARQCKICMDAEVGIVFLPCGHLTTCVNCAPNLEDCPMCRSAIKATVRTFLS